MSQLLREHADRDELAALVDAWMPGTEKLIRKYCTETGSAGTMVEHHATHRAVLACYLQAVDAWPAGKSNWLSLSRFCMKRAQSLAVPGESDPDRLRLHRVLEDKAKRRRVFKNMIGAMHETTMKVNYHALNRDFESASFGLSLCLCLFLLFWCSFGVGLCLLWRRSM